MLRVGLTGTMGSGKSTVGHLLARHGAVVIDTDQLARDVTAPGTAGHDAVLARFGPEVASGDGTLDRGALAAIVFNDPPSLAALEQLVHPLVGVELDYRLAAVGDVPVVVIEVPLLDRQRCRRYGIDRVVLVRSDRSLATRRSAGQRGLSEAEVRARQDAQPGDSQRMALADRVITNDGTQADLAAAVGQLWEWLVS